MRNPSPTLAAFLSFIWPGLGQVYAGDTRRGIIWTIPMFLIVIAGGWIGVLFPSIAFSSPAEAVFPHSLLNNTYFYAHVHLQFAQLQHFLGFASEATERDENRPLVPRAGGLLDIDGVFLRAGAPA
jgi:TM2 domain-containing membrane protein YozV